MKLTDLKPAPYNPRKIGREALDGLQASLVEFGDISGIVLNERTGHLVAGHQRVEALKREYGDVPISNGVIDANGHRIPIRVVDWDEDRERLANVAANNPHVAGEFTDALEDIIRGLERTDYASLLEPLKLNDLLPPVVPEVVEDEVPECPEEPVTKPGDLWLLGDHRVLCGDCLTADFDTSACVAMLTDPPYGMGDKRIRDGCDPAKPNKAAGWDDKAFDIRLLPIKKFKTLIWGAQYYGGAPLELGLMTWSCWDKQTRDMGSVPHGALELCCANFGKMQVWCIQWGPYQSMHQKVDHPTSKPVKLISETVVLATEEGEAVYDPFLGSGTTLIAAEQLGRKCYGIEIEPKYCDVIVKRWETLTGREAERA